MAMKTTVHTSVRHFVFVSAFAALLFMSNAFGAELVVNGDFEADTEGFVTWPGYVGNGQNPAEVSGWTGSGGRGVNPINDPADARAPAPFRDNGDNDTSVAFLQGAATLEQDVTGFVVGTEYTFSLDFNARNCGGDFPIGTVLLNDVVIASSAALFPDPGAVIPVGGANAWYHADIPFTATDITINLKISSAPAAGGDVTLVVDNISIVPEPSTAVLALCGFAAIVLARLRRN